MGDDHTPVGDLGRHLRQTAGDVLVGHAVEAVAAHAFCIEALRHRIMVRQRGVTAMKGGVEASDLRQLGRPRQQRADRRQIVRLMERRQRDQALKLVQHIDVDQDRPVIPRTAVHDPMPDRGRLVPVGFAQPFACYGEGGRDVGDAFGRVGFIDEQSAVGVHGAQPRLGTDAVHLPLDQAREAVVLLRSEQLEFDARRTRVEDEDSVHNGQAGGGAAARRRASTWRTATDDARRARAATMPAVSALAICARFFAGMLRRLRRRSRLRRRGPFNPT